MQWNVEDVISYQCNQALRNKSNFSIKWPVRSWYGVKQINQIYFFCKV